MNEDIKQRALLYHSSSPAGKLAVIPSKPVKSLDDFSLAYTPGVAAPCIEISLNQDDAYKYTTKGNTVAVISNGTAVLGLGDIGALASKPVMEGKALLLRQFGQINGIDIEVDSKNVQEIVQCIKCIAISWGGINLEDIKAPECFLIEQQLKELLDIPVFHDDQHGTAIVVLAGLINALRCAKKEISSIKIVVVGAGAAAIACCDLMVSQGVRRENVIMCDSMGVIFDGRTGGMNPWKEKYATRSAARTLPEALNGADVLLGLSARGTIAARDIALMNDCPIIFSLANPVPEITPDEAYAVRKDAIVATGGPAYPNQINNVLAFPYIFRGALDVRARDINTEMKLAAAKVIAEIAHEPVPPEVRALYPHEKLEVGSAEYLVPKSFDPRLFSRVSSAVAEAAVRSGVA